MDAAQIAQVNRRRAVVARNRLFAAAIPVRCVAGSDAEEIPVPETKSDFFQRLHTDGPRSILQNELDEDEENEVDDGTARLVAWKNRPFNYVVLLIKTGSVSPPPPSPLDLFN